MMTLENLIHGFVLLGIVSAILSPHVPTTNKHLHAVIFAGPAALSLVIAIGLSRPGAFPSLSCLFWATTFVFGLASAGCYRITLAHAARFGGIGLLTLGSIGFIAGFFGPIVFAPESNIAPIGGILVTGPVGSLVGTLAGVTISPFFKSRRQQAPAGDVLKAAPEE
jgi:hypothetical protein